MLVRAILLKDLLDLYVLRHQISKSNKKNLSGCIITLKDWSYCNDIIAFMKLMFLLVKDLKGKSETG